MRLASRSVACLSMYPEGDDVEAGERCYVVSVVLLGWRQRMAQANDLSTIHRWGSRTKPRFAFRGCIGGRLAHVALVDVGEPDVVADISRHGMQASRWPSVSTVMCTFDPRSTWRRHNHGGCRLPASSAGCGCGRSPPSAPPFARRRARAEALWSRIASFYDRMTSLAIFCFEPRAFFESLGGRL